MEEENKDDPEFDVTAIDSIKTSLMGPLAGLGDSFFWGTLRLIATGVGTSLAMQRKYFRPYLVHFDFQYSAHSVSLSSNRLGISLRNGFLKRSRQTV